MNNFIVTNYYDETIKYMKKFIKLNDLKEAYENNKKEFPQKLDWELDSAYDNFRHNLDVLMDAELIEDFIDYTMKYE